jgi:alpha-soluble NSF attachment protein
MAVSDAREGEDEQALTDAALDFDSVVKLDNWKTKVLLDIKSGIQESGGDFR